MLSESKRPRRLKKKKPDQKRETAVAGDVTVILTGPAQKAGEGEEQDEETGKQEKENVDAKNLPKATVLSSNRFKRVFDDAVSHQKKKHCGIKPSKDPPSET